MIKRLFLLCLAVFAVAMAVPSTRAQIQARGVAPVMNAIGARLAPGRLTAMADQLDVRLGRGEDLPAGNFPAWLRRDFSGSDFDPWGNSWYIQVGRRDYTVGSMGPDGQQGTEDDITERRSLTPPRR